MSGVLVHEWIEPSGGAEKVLDSMAKAFPGIDIQCLWSDASDRYPGHRVSETWLAQSPLRTRKALALPFTAPTWRTLKAQRDYDWMLVSSHLFAHHAKFAGQPDLPKYVYAHTPARYIWTPELDERGSRPLIKAVVPMFRALDRRRAQEATAIAANSSFVQQRIADTWERDSQVIYPPVSTDRIRSQADWRALITDASELAQLARLPEEFILGVSRFIPYKRLDLVIKAGAAAGVPVVIAGTGPEEAALRALAATSSVPVHFVIFPSEAFLLALFQLAKVFVFPPVEDFGIVPVEAQAAGTPVVVGPVGGQRETLIPNVSGIVANSTSVSDLSAAITAARELPRFDAAAVTERFSEAEFSRNIREFVSGS